MIAPPDSPTWVIEVLKSAEEKAERQVSESHNSDEAMKASGAYSLWRFIKGEVEFEAEKQANKIREQRQALHARTTN